MLVRATIEPIDAGGVASGLRREVVTAAEVVAAGGAALEAVVAVEVRTGLARVDDLKGGDVWVLIRNKSAVTVTVQDITTKAPAHVRVRPQVLASVVPFELAPFQTRSLGYEIVGDRRVAVGKKLVLFHVAVTWGNAGEENRGTLVESKEFDVGVFGDSELHAVLQVPLLIVPGVVGLAGAALLWRCRVRFGRAPSPEFPLPAKSGEFWLCAATLSVLALLARSAWVRRSWPSLREALTVYGSSDIAWVSMVALGAAAAVLGALCLTSKRSARRSHLVEGGGADLTLIDQLARHRSDILVELGVRKVGTTDEQVMILTSDWARTGVYIAPQLIVVIPGHDAASQSLEAAVVSALHATEDGLPRLAAALRAQPGLFSLHWRGIGTLGAVRRVAASEVTGVGRYAPWIVLGI